MKSFAVIYHRPGAPYPLTQVNLFDTEEQAFQFFYENYSQDATVFKVMDGCEGMRNADGSFDGHPNKF